MQCICWKLVNKMPLKWLHYWCNSTACSIIVMDEVPKFLICQNTGSLVQSLHPNCIIFLWYKGWFFFNFLSILIKVSTKCNVNVNYKFTKFCCMQNIQWQKSIWIPLYKLPFSYNNCTYTHFKKVLIKVPWCHIRTSWFHKEPLTTEDRF